MVLGYVYAKLLNLYDYLYNLQIDYMEGSNLQFLLKDKKQFIKQSSIILNYHPQQSETNNLPSPRRNISASTFINAQQYQLPELAGKRSFRFQHDLGFSAHQIQREKSLRPEIFRDKIQKESQEQHSEHINNNFIRLKVQQMAFKFKTKMATLLKQINVSTGDLNKYSKLVKIDDMLSFLSQKVKERLSSTQINQSNSSRLRERQKQVVRQLSEVVQGLRKKLQQRELSQKQHKAKLKQNHNEIKQLYDQINQKQRQVSIKTTELYQHTIQIQEHQKHIITLENKYAALEKQYEMLKVSTQNGHKNIYNHCAQLEEKERQYQEEIRELKQNITMLSEKQVKLLNFNKGISEQVERWRERFQFQRERKGVQKQGLKWQESRGSQYASKSQGRKDIFGRQENKTTRSYNVQQTNQLLTIIGIHEQEIHDLKNENATLQLFKKKYQLFLEQRNKAQDEKGRLSSVKETLGLQSKSQIESFYRKKMQQMSGQWRQKLIQLVDSYSIQENKKKIKMQQLQKDKRQADKKLFILANQKYQLECKMIQRDDQIYRLNKQLNSSNKNINVDRSRDQQLEKQVERIELVEDVGMVQISQEGQNLNE